MCLWTDVKKLLKKLERMKYVQDWMLQNTKMCGPQCQQQKLTQIRIKKAGTKKRCDQTVVIVWFWFAGGVVDIVRV